MPGDLVVGEVSIRYTATATILVFVDVFAFHNRYTTPIVAVGFSVNPSESLRCSGGSPGLVGIVDGATTSHRWQRLVSWR